MENFDRDWQLAYTAADPDFFDSPERVVDAAGRFHLSDTPPPVGWRRMERGLWVNLFPSEDGPPAQGWKIHVSAIRELAEQVIGVVAGYCFAERMAFKFLPGAYAYLLQNDKNADRAGSGKLLTLYPGDDTALRRCLDHLSQDLSGIPGPRILSDLRYGDAPVFVRYGGFRQRRCFDTAGDEVPAVADGEGQLVPDQRLPIFQVPSWAPVPDFLAGRIADFDSDVSETPYRVESALHYSNAGGVYLATDQRTSRRVVLKEARPYAGLDSAGTDAVTRLDREYQALRQLADTGLVPRPLERFAWAEHQFLAMEHIAGESLFVELNRRQPLGHPGSGAADLAEFTAWALDRLREVESILDVVHRRGIVVGDVHPHNFLVRPDGRVALVDLEASFEAAQAGRRSTMGAAGFIAPPGITGVDVDRHALGRMMVFFFTPVTPLLDRYPEKIESLLELAESQFALPADFRQQVLDLLRPSGSAANSGSAVVDGSPRRVDPAFHPPVRVTGGADGADWQTDWAAVEASLVAGIMASATPDRPDRLFPGDPLQFRHGGHGLAYGAAGVLHALAETGARIPASHVEWLVDRAALARPAVGLFDGLYGVSWLLRRLEWSDEADRILDRALDQALTPRAHLFGGAAGAVLALLDAAGSEPAASTGAAASSGRSGLRSAAQACGERLVDMVDRHRDGRAAPRGGLAAPAVPGLMYGHTGVALALTRLYEVTGDKGWLDAARDALSAELAHTRPDSGDSLQVHDGRRLLPYLAKGSAGVAVAVDRYLAHRDDDTLRAARQGLRNACTPRLTVFAGLFDGLSGILAYLAQAPAEGIPSGVPDALVRRLFVHVVSRGGQLAFPGDQLARISTDLATGTAGVLLTLRAARGLPAEVLPLVLGGWRGPGDPGAFRGLADSLPAKEGR